MLVRNPYRSLIFLPLSLYAFTICSSRIQETMLMLTKWLAWQINLRGSLENYLLWKGNLKLNPPLKVSVPFGFTGFTRGEPHILEVFPFVCQQQGDLGQNPKGYNLDKNEHMALEVLITKKGKYSCH